MSDPTRQQVLDYLDTAIRHWRGVRDRAVVAWLLKHGAQIMETYLLHDLVQTDEPGRYLVFRMDDEAATRGDTDG